MEKFVVHTGQVVAINRSNIDTDQIIPKQFLKRVERTGYGEFLFNDWRFDPEGKRVSDFALNNPEFSEASILVTGTNFGCGSSREHAPWSLLDYGFRTVIAPSFGDIFYNNGLKNGLLPIRLDQEIVDRIIARANEPPFHLTINLSEQIVSGDDFPRIPFQIDPFNKNCLLHGLDEIGLTLIFEDEIAAYENRASKAANT